MRVCIGPYEIHISSVIVLAAATTPIIANRREMSGLVIVATWHYVAITYWATKNCP